MLPARKIFSIPTQNMTYCIRINVTLSNGQVGVPFFFSSTAVSSIQTSDFKLYSIRALLHVPSVAQNITIIFAFFISFIVHFLLVFFTSKNA
jgi:hypothetical protein